MLAGLKSTPPRLPTFCERMRLTYALCLMRLPLPVVWLRTVWSIGATVNISPINPQSARLVIVRGDGAVMVTVTITKNRVTP